MPAGRAYRASLTVSADIGDPSGRVYEAALSTTEPQAPMSGRVYQALITTAAGGTGTGRVYQARVSAALPVTFTPSGVTARRGGNAVPISMRAQRGGAL